MMLWMTSTNGDRHVTDHPRRARRIVTALCATLVLGSLAACSGESTPSPMPAAQALATALASGDFAAVPMLGATPSQATAQIAAAVKGMAAAKRAVKVTQASAAKDGKSATATFAVSWDVDATPADWTYQTTAQFQRTKKTWSLTWSPAVLHPRLGPGTTLQRARTIPPRADILGAGGVALVANRPVRRVGIDKTRLPAAAAVLSARQLAAVLGVDPAGYAAQVAAAGPQAFVEAIILRLPDLAPLAGKIAAVPGAVQNQ